MLNCQKDKFSLDPGHHYLNCAYMSPMLKISEKAGIEGIRSKSNPFRVTPDDFFDPPSALRESFAKLINAHHPDRVVIIPSVSYLISTVAKNIKLKRRHEILLVDQQFPSQVYPWMRKSAETGATLKVIRPPESLENRAARWNEKILKNIGNRTRVVCLGNVHWADGTLFDLLEIRSRTRKVGARLIIDGTQSVGAMPMDVQAVQPDAIACAAYKFLLGPYSIGMGYFAKTMDGGVPIEENWINRDESERFEKLVEYQDNYKPKAHRYAAGEHSNFIMVPMLKAAIDQILEWKPEHIQEYCAGITRAPIASLRENGFWVEDENYRGSHLFGIRLPKGMSMDKVREKLKAENIYVSQRGNSIRISPHVYNTEEEIMKLQECLTSLLP